MKQHLGNHIGMVINSTDPEYRGRVQVFGPHIMPAIYEGWNEEGQDIEISCVGSNIPEGLTPEIHARLVKILPWAEAASPIIGSSAPGNLFSDIVSGVKSAAGAAYDAVAGAVNHTFNQGPTSEPTTVEGGDAQALIDKAKGITGLSFDGAKWGKCARGTTGLDKAAGLIDNNGPSAGFVSASDLAAGGSNETGYNPYTQGAGAKHFEQPFTVDPGTYKPQVGDSVFCGGGGGEGYGHAQKCVGFDKSGKAVWVSDNPQTHFFTQNKTASYNNFTVYRLNDEGLSRYTAAIGGKITGQESPSSSNSSHAAVADPAAPNNLARSDGKTETAPVPQTNLVANPEAGMTGTVSGGGTVSNGPKLGNQNAVPSPTPITTYSVGKSVGGTDETQDKWTNRGYTSTGKNLTPGTVAVDTNVHPLGTIFKDSNTGNVYVATDRHGNKNPNVVDVYVPPSQYTEQSGSMNLAVIGSIPKNEIPKTSEGIQGLLSQYGQVPPGESASAFLAGNNAGVTAELALGSSGAAAGRVPSIVNNTDSNGRTPVINTNDMASGLFSYPNPGAMVWVFFREGNPLFPVYFAASYSSAEWKSAYRGGSPAEAYTNDGKTIGRGTVAKFGEEGGILTQSMTNMSDALANSSSLSLFHQHGSNITMKDGCDFYFSRNNKRDEVDNDRFIITKGYKEEWIEGDASTNTRGNLIVKVGNISAEAIAAMQELSNMSYEMNQMLMDKPKGGSSGGSGETKKAAKTESATPANAPVNYKAPVSDAFSPQRQPFGGSGTTTAQFKDSIKAAPVQTVPGANVASSQQAPKAVGGSSSGITPLRDTLGRPLGKAFGK